MAWKEFIAREIGFCTVRAHVLSYAGIVSKLIDHPLRRALYFFDGQITHIIHEEKEMLNFKQAIKAKIDSDPNWLSRVLAQGVKYNSWAKKFLKDDSGGDIENIINFFANYLAYAVHIPHRLSWVFESFDQLDKKSQRQLAILRTESYWLDINNKFLRLIAEYLKNKFDCGENPALFDPYELTGEKVLPNKKEIQKRHSGYLFSHVGGRERIITGQAAKKVFAGLNLEDNHNKITGQVAFAGKVNGSVQVITDSGELDQIKAGEIIVANMTTVEFVPYLKKVKAIITNEGGLTCHAAIMSREMKIPCVIGTKNATKILRTGQVIAFDTNLKYPVKIIKK